MDLKDVIVIVDRTKYHIFEDYLKSLKMKLRFYPCRINKGEKIIVVQLLLNLNYEDASFVGLLNTEQLTKEEWSSYIKNVVMKSNLPLTLFDYSIGNVEHLKKICSYPSVLLPYKEYDEECNRLKFLLATTPKEYDLAFIGNGQRREDKINELRAQGLKIYHIDGKWLDDRDREVAKCRALLNLHFSEEFLIFEEIRCNRWMSAGLPVLTEDSLYFDATAFKPCISVSFDKIVPVALLCKELTWDTIKTKVLAVRPALTRIFTFSFDSEQPDQQCLNSISPLSGVAHIHITSENLNQYLPTPLHPIFQYLTPTQKVDYLKCYFMHHLGGGYTNIIPQPTFWLEKFFKLDSNPYYLATSVISDQAYIFKPNSVITEEWYQKVNALLDFQYNQLKNQSTASFENDKTITNFSSGARLIFHSLFIKYCTMIL